MHIYIEMLYILMLQKEKRGGVKTFEQDEDVQIFLIL